MPKLSMVAEYHMRRAAVDSPEAAAEREARLKKRLFLAHFGGKCCQCRLRPRRAPNQRMCRECHSRIQSASDRRRRRLVRWAKAAEAQRLRSLAWQRKRERANPAYFDWAAAPDRTM